ncbi:hypothetical protein CDAR_406441 [Caerostris darwini]|uniref:Uncharacterized protein n=1 Tax=Caerostris darwini TaxID=1538125 RepID=A0AAV4MLU3_9ARAC|nr:hypothetical protein CDAR_406441 [Caerostris darwini]
MKPLKNTSSLFFRKDCHLVTQKITMGKYPLESNFPIIHMNSYPPGFLIEPEGQRQNLKILLISQKGTVQNISTAPSFNSSQSLENGEHSSLLSFGALFFGFDTTCSNCLIHFIFLSNIQHRRVETSLCYKIVPPETRQGVKGCLFKVKDWLVDEKHHITRLSAKRAALANPSEVKMLERSTKIGLIAVP